jgi:zinc transport system permease protein
VIDDFLVRALVGGIGVALMAGPLGCFVVWRRMAYFGSALAHSALLGVALGFLLGIDLTVGVLALCVMLALLLLLMERQRALPSDTLLGILAHSSLAVGLVVVAFMDRLRIDLMGYLFGDVLAVGMRDIGLIWAMLAATLVLLVLIWRPLLSTTVHEDLAAVEGVRVGPVRLLFMLMIAAVIAVGMQVVGILLIVSLLIIPAAAARRMVGTPEAMAVLAALLGAASVALGLAGSWHLDIPSGPAIVVAATGFFVVVGAAAALRTGTRGQGNRLKKGAG